MNRTITLRTQSVRSLAHYIGCFTLLLTSLFASAQNRTDGIMSHTIGKQAQYAFELYHDGNIDGAIISLENTLQQATKPFDRAYIYRMLGNLYASQSGKSSQALLMLRKAMELNVLNTPEHASVIKLYADLNLQAENFTEALSYYQKWVYFTDTKDGNVFGRMAQTSYFLKNYDEAVKYADLANRYLQKPTESFYLVKIAALYELKRYRDTAKVYGELVNLYPQNKNYRTQQIQLHLLDEDYRQAKKVFIRAIKDNVFALTEEKDVKLFLMLAQVFTSEGNYEASFQIYKGSLPLLTDTDRKHDLFKSLLLIAPKLSNDRFDDIVSLIERYSDIEHEPYYFSSIGRIGVEKGLYKQAISILNLALNFKNKYQEFEILYDLAFSYYEVGKQKPAINFIERAINLPELTNEQNQLALALQKLIQSEG